MIDLSALSPLQRAMLGLWLLGMTVIENTPHDENVAKMKENDLDMFGIPIDCMHVFLDLVIRRMETIDISEWLRANVPGFEGVAG